jgi:hypothetical protein
LSDLSKSLVETCQPGSNAMCDVAMILLGHWASWREGSRLSRVARAPAQAPMIAALAGCLAAEIAELGAARAFDVMASLCELDGARAVRAKLELDAAFVRFEHLLLVFFLGLAHLLATMVDDISDVFELGGAVEAAETLAADV